MESFRHLYPFQSRFMDRCGLRYHYLDEGTGDPLVMIHGNPTWSFYFRELVNELSSGYRTIVPDHIGCGLSDKPDDHNYHYTLESRVDDLEALLDHLGIADKITLIVHDWGGMIGLAYALRHITRIRRLVITNTSGFLPPGGKAIPFRLWLIRHIAPFAAPAVRGLNAFSVGALYMATGKGLSNDVKAGLKAPYNNWKNRIATLRFVQDIPVKPSDPSYALVRHVDDNLIRLKDISMMICWGAKDFVFDLDYLAEWRRRFPDAEVHEFPDAGHYILEDEAPAMRQLIRGFLDRHPI